MPLEGSDHTAGRSSSGLVCSAYYTQEMGCLSSITHGLGALGPLVI
jgi:hypothetical protein